MLLLNTLNLCMMPQNVELLYSKRYMIYSYHIYIYIYIYIMIMMSVTVIIIDIGDHVGVTPRLQDCTSTREY